MKNKITASLPIVFWALLIASSLLWNIRNSPIDSMLIHGIALVLITGLFYLFLRSRDKRIHLMEEMKHALDRAKTADALAGQIAVHQGFSKTAQYLAGLTAEQDPWDELAKAIVNFLGADLAAFGQRGPDGRIYLHHWTHGKEKCCADAATTVEIEEDVADVLESGFLAMRQVLAPEPCAMLFLPMTHRNQTTAVVAVGHNGLMRFSEELTNAYLSVAGLAGTMFARLVAESALREAHEQLENRVRERTEALFAANQNLEAEIDQRKRIENALRESEEERIKVRKLEATGILAGGIAHDFNNLLAVILGNIELAKDDAAPGSFAFGALHEAEEAVSRAGDLTQQFITFSTGGNPWKTPASIRELIADSCSLTSSGDSNVECRCSFPDDLWLTDIDLSQMSQVIDNVLANAKEAMPEGGIIDIIAENMRIGSQDEGMEFKKGPYVRIAVRDHGIGIPEDILGKVFDPYYSTKERGSQKGMGMGLTIAYSIVEKHAGHIMVESAPRAGTTVSIYLPAIAPAPTPN